MLADAIEIVGQGGEDIDQEKLEKIEDGRLGAPGPSKEENVYTDLAKEQVLHEPDVQLPRIQLKNGVEPQSHSTRIESQARKPEEGVDDKKVTS